MRYAQKAIDLQPDKPDGYYHYGVNVGIYSDGVSIVTALAEGLKDKTQSSFEAVEDSADAEKRANHFSAFRAAREADAPHCGRGALLPMLFAGY